MEKLSHKTYTIELSASGRFKLTSRALFIFASELFAIFQVSICGGLKPPLFSCFLQVCNEEDACVAWHGWTIQVSARFFFVLTALVQFSYILILFHYNIKVAKQLSWWKVVLASLGTWVRIPGPPYFSMFFIFPCSGDQRAQKSTMRSHQGIAKWP